MKINHIQVHNFRGTEDLNIDFNAGMNILVGSNGKGKTTLLNAIAVALSGTLSALSLNERWLNDDDVRCVTARAGDVVTATKKYYPVSVTADIEMNNREYQYTEILETPGAGIGISNWDLQNRIKEVYDKHEMSLPLLCFQRAGRGSSIKRPVVTSLPEGTPDRLEGYRGAFQEALNIEQIQQWCLQMEFAEFQDGKKAHEYEVFQQIVGRFMQTIDRTEQIRKVYYSPKDTVLMYANEDGAQPIYQLSSGYQIILCMVMELAYRAVLLNPKMNENAQDLSGVVLIDEIEMHLHPAWQWRILRALQNTFPNVQWIIATHSPIILSSAENASLYLLRSPNEIEQIDNAYGYDINDVLSIRQGSEYQPAEITAYYHKAEEILDHGTDQEIQDLLKKAEIEFENSPSVYKNLEDFIEVNRWVEEG